MAAPIARRRSLLALLAVAACGGDRPSTTAPPATGGAQGGAPATPPGSFRKPGPPRMATLAELTPAERQWGIAPVRSPDVTYQPDVVLIDRGPEAIRAMSANGLEWTLDVAAVQGADVTPGKVLFVTGRMVGRVLDVKKKDDTLVVILGPVELTEVISDVRIEFSAPVDFSQASQFSAPELPGVAADATPLKVSTTEPVRRFGLMRALATGAEPMTYRRAASDLSVGNFRISPKVGLTGLGAEISADANGLHFNSNALLRLEKPRLSFVLDISKGKLVTCELELVGAAGIAMEFNLVSSTGFASNVNQSIYVPSDFSIPLLGKVVPFSITVRQAYLVKTAIGAKGRLQADGDYSVSGGFSIGYRNGKLGVGGPTRFKANHPIVDSISGISPTASGIVLAHQTRVIVGIGAFGFATGPYFTMTNTMGITRSSDLDTLTRCRMADVIVSVDAGVGYFMPKALTTGINFFLKAMNLRQIKGEGGVTLGEPQKLVNVHTFSPNSKACGGR
jgi:hypothetical protein